MLLFLFVLLLPLNLWAAPPANEFQIGDYRALALLGQAKILGDVHYVSFTGDFGFAGRLPSEEVVERHIAQESALLSNFQLKVINLEFMLPGNSKRELDRQIDRVTIDLMKRTGYDRSPAPTITPWITGPRELLTTPDFCNGCRTQNDRHSQFSCLQLGNRRR